MLSMALVLVAVSASANAGRRSFAGIMCLKAWNNADFEKDFFWAATGHWHGPWYQALRRALPRGPGEYSRGRLVVSEQMAGPRLDHRDAERVRRLRHAVGLHLA
jgi:hypothetical protein